MGNTKELSKDIMDTILAMHKAGMSYKEFGEVGAIIRTWRKQSLPLSLGLGLHARSRLVGYR